MRLLVQDVTLLKTDKLLIQVRFRGGAIRTLTIPPARRIWQTWQTPPAVVATIDSLLNDYTDAQVATILNPRGVHPGKRGTFDGRLVASLRRTYGLKCRYTRLREAGMLSAEEIAARLGVTAQTVNIWRRAGLLRAYAYDDKNSCLFEPPGPNPPTKCQGRKLAKRRMFPEVASECTEEVQYEA